MPDRTSFHVAINYRKAPLTNENADQWQLLFKFDDIVFFYADGVGPSTTAFTGFQLI